ncbi:MAG TPA: 23S rRNA (uracil(1939)-C(5))-methyltransferase RlmD [Roseiflexaceae bacterium]|nr:23S rRNA (uracil(1939)-C(5))-methyltransferase RlmD [Roseiflexaceae bacterium]
MTQIDWPSVLELTLDGIAQGGEGVGRWQDRVVFARGGLPGERVQVRLRERREAYARGDVVEVFEASADRVAPRLPGADHMPWQHIAYPAQLGFKRQILADQLAKIGGFADLPVAETLAAARPWGYRNSARLHSLGGRIGYYAAESHDLQEIEADPLLLPVLNDALAALRAVVGAGAPAPAEVILRASEAYGYALAALPRPERPQGRGADAEATRDLRELATRWRMRCPALAGITLPGGAGQPSVALGADQLIEELGGIAFHLRPTTFFQVNGAAAETLLGLVRAGLELEGGERLLDLYCGAGAFALPLAGTAAEVLGVEEYASAVEDGRTTAAANGIDNVRFEVGRVEAALRELEGPFDAVVLDPPRRGCHPLAIQELLRLAPARIVYVACHPATLARDLKLLAAGGYRVVSVQPIDLFPQTAHIESVVVLARE